VSNVSELKHAATGTGVELRYGDLVALTSCDFVVPAGRTTAVIGPNGSGKSTLLAAIAGIHEPSTGSVTVLETTPQEASPRVAFVPQSTKVNDALPVTVQEVVMMGRYPSLGFLRRFGEPDRTAVAGAIERLNLSDLSARHLSELSGGQRQRVFVAQGLAQDRDMLLLDEPMTGLDGVSAVVVNGVIREERAEGRTVVVTTHDLEEAQACDHVILVNGTVVAQGTPDDVLTAEILSEVYRSQVVDLEGRLLFDDPAHATHAPRHVHSDRAASTHPHDDV
jgi:manganese transport system ATP-binding protein